MKALQIGLLVSLVCAAPLAAQERERSLERISLALQQPPAAIRGLDAMESMAPKTFGVFTLVPPQARGEIVRVSVPIGALISRAFGSMAAAAYRRQEAAARRQVEADLEWFANQAAPSRGSAGVSSRNW